MTPLLDDIARCNDHGCQLRLNCLRFLEREEGGPRTAVYSSLRPYSPFSDTCANHWPPYSLNDRPDDGPK
jgi:hypothetical protein